MIPLVDLQAGTRELEAELKAAIDRVVTHGQFVAGAEVEAFERAWAAFTGAAHVVAVASGTDAVELMVRGAELGQDDSVLVPANTFIASALGVLRAGARVKLVDCTEDGLIDLNAARVDATVKAVMPVHLFGQCVDVAALQAFASTLELLVLEDAAQAHGATWCGHAAGTFGQSAAVSFYPGKNLGAFGDGGAVMTRDEAVARRLRVLRNYGAEVKYEHRVQGLNSRLDALQAAVLSVKLTRLAEWNARRVAAAARYDELLRDLPDVVCPRVLPDNGHVFHLYVVRVPATQRDRVLAALHRAGVGAGIHYPIPLHLQGALAHLGHRPGDFPVAERLAGEMISLPMFPQLTFSMQEEVVSALRRAMEGS
jgi:dTDP-4-amino-4,6-dideoxygalactose transaminase